MKLTTKNVKIMNQIEFEEMTGCTLISLIQTIDDSDKKENSQLSLFD